MHHQYPTSIQDLHKTIIHPKKKQFQENYQKPLGVVYKVQGVRDVYTVKEIQKMNAHYYGREKQVQKELFIYDKIKNKPFFVKVRQIVKNPHQFLIFMDYYQNNLRQFLTKKWNYIQNNLFWKIKIFLHILYAKVELNLTHRDLKLQNFMVNFHESGDFQVLMTDFGDVKDIVGVTNSFVGTRFYQAPQIRQQSEQSYYDDKVDCWGIGTILYQLFYSVKKKDKLLIKFPFAETLVSKQEYKKRIRYEEDEDYGIITSKKVPAMINQLIRKTLQKNPEDRFSFEDILKYVLENQDFFFRYHQKKDQQKAKEQFYQYFCKFQKNNWYKNQQRERYNENIKFIRQSEQFLQPLFKILYDSEMNNTVLQFIYGRITQVQKRVKWFKERCELNRRVIKGIISEESEEQFEKNRIKIRLRLLREEQTEVFKKKQKDGYYAQIIKVQSKRQIIFETLKLILQSQYQKFQKELSPLLI